MQRDSDALSMPKNIHCHIAACLLEQLGAPSQSERKLQTCGGLWHTHGPRLWWGFFVCFQDSDDDDGDDTSRIPEHELTEIPPHPNFCCSLI